MCCAHFSKTKRCEEAYYSLSYNMQSIYCLNLCAQAFCIKRFLIDNLCVMKNFPGWMSFISRTSYRLQFIYKTVRCRIDTDRFNSRTTATTKKVLCAANGFNELYFSNESTIVANNFERKCNHTKAMEDDSIDWNIRKLFQLESVKIFLRELMALFFEHLSH